MDAGELAYVKIGRSRRVPRRDESHKKVEPGFPGFWYTAPRKRL
jgi:hypothetical protein